MSLLDKINLNEEMTEQKDFIPSGSYTQESGVYPATIDLAYLTKSQGGATGVCVHFKEYPFETFTIRETFWITTKAGVPYYVKNGEKFQLPGLQHVNHLCEIATGQSLGQQTVEEKMVKLWSFETRSEAPTKVEVLTDLLGKQVQVGVLKVEDNKRVQADGKWINTADKRTFNEVDRIFSEDGHTRAEILAGEPADFIEKWKAKNDGVPKIKYQQVAGGASTPAASGGTPKPATGTSLFD